MPVGALKPNDFGLFDVHGNVWCWCQCRYREYPKVIAAKPRDDIEDLLTIDATAGRVLRGGAVHDSESNLRSAQRVGHVPTLLQLYLGFRVARTIAS